MFFTCAPAAAAVAYLRSSGGGGATVAAAHRRWSYLFKFPARRICQMPVVAKSRQHTNVLRCDFGAYELLAYPKLKVGYSTEADQPTGKSS